MKKPFFFLMILTMCLAGLSCGSKERTQAVEQEPRSTLVRTERLVERDFTEYLVLNGSLEARNSASVGARVGGTLDRILVDKGDVVKAGQVLFTIDDQSYRDKVAVAQATLAAQTAAVEVAKAQAEKAQANFHKASLDVERFRRLFEKQNVSANELETYTLRYEAAKADLSLANSNVAAQEAQVELAKASLAICRKDLDDCTIKAPVDGCVSRRLHDPGEEVAKKDTVVTIVDTSRLRVVAALPAEHYNAIQPGKTVLRVTAEDGTSRDVVVTDKNPVIEAGLRTFELRALFDNDGEGSFVPGALVGVAVEMKRVRGYGIDISVPVRRKAGTILYTVENGRAKAIPVETGISQDGMVHVAADGLDAEMPIIVEGQYMIQDGDAVKVK